MTRPLALWKFSLVGGADGVDDDGKACNSYTNEFGTFRVYADGTYTFALNNASDDVKALKAGELKAISATLRVTDSNHQETTQGITVNIKGTASAPEVIAVTGDKDPSLSPDHGDYGYDINAVSNAGKAYSYTAKGQIVAKDCETKDYEAGTAPDFTASPAFTVKTQVPTAN